MNRQLPNVFTSVREHSKGPHLDPKSSNNLALGLGHREGLQTHNQRSLPLSAEQEILKAPHVIKPKEDGASHRRQGQEGKRRINYAGTMRKINETVAQVISKKRGRNSKEGGSRRLSKALLLLQTNLKLCHIIKIQKSNQRTITFEAIRHFEYQPNPLQPRHNLHSLFLNSIKSRRLYAIHLTIKTTTFL